MKRSRPLAVFVALLLGLTSALAGATAPAGVTAPVTTALADRTSRGCERLVALQLEHATVTVAQLVTGGTFVPPGTPSVPLTGLPEFCRVAGISMPSSDSRIAFEVWIPTGTGWNAKYQQIGNGGFAGTIPYAALAAALVSGFAAGGTDDGHSGSAIDASWALGHPQKIIDFGYRSLKETTDKAKTIIQAFTGLRPRRSYFDGCSDGGREALMEAERFPDDFDGIVAGSPANFWSRLLTSFIWDEQALLDNPASYIPSSQLPILTTAALALCAGKDGGLKGDGFLNDPRSCHFNARIVRCKAGQSRSTCLTDAQVVAANRIYEGLRSPRTHAQLFPGFEPGSEGNSIDWPAWITGPTPGTSLQYFFGQQYFANFVFGNPVWPIQALNFTSDVALADAFAPILNSTNPDLRRFIRHGGKLIHYVGWADAAIQPENTLNYYNSVLLFGGGNLARLQNSYRLFAVPGMAHCSGGPGPNAFGNIGSPSTPATFDADHNVVLALDRWVERGVAPERIVATKYVDDVPSKGVAFARPLCPYPRVSRYRGYGNARSAESFACVEDNAAFAADISRAIQYLLSNTSVLFNPRS